MLSIFEVWTHVWPEVKPFPGTTFLHAYLQVEGALVLWLISKQKVYANFYRNEDKMSYLLTPNNAEK